MTYTYTHPHPALTVDCVVFGISEVTSLQILLIERGSEPEKGSWALPGGFVEMDEHTDQAAARELEEETNVTGIYLEQLQTFSKVERDPRERVVSVAYYGLVSPKNLDAIAGSDAKKLGWFSVDHMPRLAFDHADIVASGLRRVRAKIKYEPIGFELLPKEFTLSQLQRVYEIVLGHNLDKRNFLRKVHKMDVLKNTGLSRKGITGKPAAVYAFDLPKYLRLAKAGLNFDL